MPQTPMARLPWMIRTQIESLRNSYDTSRKQNLGIFPYFVIKNVCYVYSLE